MVEWWSPGWPQGKGDTVVEGWLPGWPQGSGEVEGWSPGWPLGRVDTMVEGWSPGWPQGSGEVEGRSPGWPHGRVDTMVEGWLPGWPQGMGDTVVDGWSPGGVTAWCTRQGERQCQRWCSRPTRVPRLVFGQQRIPRSVMRWNTSAHSLNFVPWVTNTSINVTKAVKSMFLSKSGFRLVDKWRNTECLCPCEKLLTRPAATAITNKSRWTRIMEKASSTQTSVIVNVC